MENKMSAAAVRGERLWWNAGDLDIADAVADYGGLVEAAEAAADFTEGSVDDIRAYLEYETSKRS